MKPFYCIGCLIIGLTIAAAVPPVAESVEDKPDRLYVKSDLLLTDSYTDSETIDSEGATARGRHWHNDNYHWKKDVGGVGSRDDTCQSDDTSSENLQWSSTNHTSSLMLWFADLTGTETYTDNNNNPVTYPICLPLLTSEHCLVNDPKSLPFTVQQLGDNCWAINQVEETYFRFSQSRWCLETGGRGEGWALFQFNATARKILDKRAERPFENVRSRSVLPQLIAIMGQSLRADTNLWTVLPRGESLDVTPFVNGADFYAMEVARQRYTPLITVNEADLALGTPEFSAGSQLTFKLEFDPPPDLASQDVLWNLTDSPVNESWQQGTNGSVNYRFNPDLLTNLSTSCWYSKGALPEVDVGASLCFSNGQNCFLVVQGGFSISRPTIADFNTGASPIGFSWNPPSLAANREWSIKVHSAYDGQVGVTQLIEGTNCGTWTGPGYRLDGEREIYNWATTNSPGQPYSVADPATHNLVLTSSRTCTADPATALSASFKDYLRFKPAGGSSNIWVTLGTNSWSMDGAASLSSGLMRSNLPPAQPVVESDEFPFWTDHL